MNFVVETLNKKQRLEYHGGRKRKSFHKRQILKWKNQSGTLVLCPYPEPAVTLAVSYCALTYFFIFENSKQMLIPFSFRKIKAYDLLSFISKKSWLLSLCMSLLVHVIVVTWHSTALVGFPHRADTSQ